MGNHLCALTFEEYCGWKTIRLSNGIVDLFIAPALGGRIIQLRFGAHDFFYVNPRHQGRVYPPQENCSAAGWKNYGGSKVWPAPQGWAGEGQWPGPPDPILDGGAYTWRILEQTPRRAVVHLESPPDGYTGLTFSKTIQIAENLPTIEIAHKMRNTSSNRVRWAIWQVTQHSVGSSLVVYARARSFRQIYGDKTFEHAGLDPKRHLWTLEYANQVAKFAVEVERGWLATVKPREGVALIEKFQIFPGESYPDGAPAEIWVNGKGTYTIPSDRMGQAGQTDCIDMAADPNGCDPFVETEILSPLVEVDPDQEYNFSLTWRPTALTPTSQIPVSETEKYRIFSNLSA
ncbi:MAG: DUF4380 domain-containing protein [Terriglobia bacterium]